MSTTTAILIDPNQTIRELDRTKFLGFTLDADQFEGDHKTSCMWELTHPTIINLCKELKPATIRIGGSGIEHLQFTDHDPDGKMPLKEGMKYSVDKAKCDALGELCKATGAGLMLSFPVQLGDVDNATRFVDYFVNQRKDHVPFLEFGNEPDWGWKQPEGKTYPEKVRTFHEAMAPLFPGKEWIAGYGGRSFPAGVCNPDTTELMRLLQTCGDVIDVVSTHYYVESSGRPYASAELMLSEHAADIASLRVKEMEMLQHVHPSKRKVAINEWNTYAWQGLDGVSNTMMAAVFVADFIGNMARSDVYASNLQCGFAKQHGRQKFWRYAMIDTRDEQIVVNPHYYAFYLWSRLMGDGVLPCYLPKAHPVTAHATRSSAGRLQVMLINKSLTESRGVDLCILEDWNSGTCERFVLSAPEPAGRNASINGFTTNADGTMPVIGAGDPCGRLENGNIHLELAPCSVTVLSLTADADVVS